jgi:topoisomerase-4 subunit A
LPPVAGLAAAARRAAWTSSRTPRTRSTAIVDEPFESAIEKRYLVYALSTITARSLPDLRDGLKPVHRRILWGMRLMRLDPGSAFKKCARITGDVMGKYHPHGNLALYDALVRLAQPFTLRYPLVEGQGNFGNIDGDGAAAERYTECRLTRTAMQLMDGLDEGTVDFVPTYNNEEEEPVVFPGLFPNLLANGASGIAVGMATNIPSHNVAEIIDAGRPADVQPDVTHAELMAVFHGPDFATGGLVVDSAEAISQAYETGRGSFRVRGRFFAAEAKDEADRQAGIERLGGGQYQLVVSEIPYMVPKGKLIEQIAQAIADRKLPILEDVRDESDEQVRLVLVPKSRNVDPELLKESLYKLTDLETRFSLNLNVLDAQRTPMVMGLHELLTNWVAHQIDILQRRSRHRLQKIADRLELVEGYIIAFLNLDRVIEIIRTEDEPKPVMMAEFGLTDRQAEAILNMRLRSLRKLEEMELRQEREELLKEQGELEQLLASPARQRTRLKRDLAALRKDYAEDTALGRRRTTIAEAAPAVEFSMDAMIEKEPVTVILSQRGWIRAARGPPAARAGLEVQGRRRTGLRAPRADHRQAAARGRRRALLHRRRRQAPRRARARRADPQHARHRRQRADRRADRAPPGTQLLLGATTGHGFAAVTDELLAETRKGRQVVNLKSGAKLLVAAADRARARPRRGGRRQPQAGGVQPRGAAGDGARAGGHAAALPRRRAGRRDHAQARRRAVVGDGRRERARADRKRDSHVEGRPRRRRPPAAAGLPTRQQVLIPPVPGRN